jgi:uncharacterized protein
VTQEVNVDSHEDRLAAWETELRAKYTQKERDEAASKGHAMDGGSYIIEDQDDLEKAIHAVGRGNADHDSIRKHIITQAARLKLSKLVPDNWNADGSLTEEKSEHTEAEERAKCSTCKGTGTILDGNRECPDCKGTGKATEQQNAARDAWDTEHREGLSYSDMRDMLANAVAAKFATGPSTRCYVADFGDDWVVYEANDGERYRCSFEVSGDTITLGTSEPVRAVTTYTPMESKSVRSGRRKERRRAVPLMPEVRFWQAEGLEVRSSKTTDEIIITGTPIVYNAPYVVTDMFGEFEERMLPGVATGVLERGADVRFLFNHDGLPLARTTSGTLTLEDSSRALQMVARLDARQQLANDLAIATERGDVSQMSCGFIVARDTWDASMEHRDVAEFADLLDVSSVTYPASPTTATQVAQRMALMAPIESRARLRQFIVAERAGKVLSGASKEKVASAIEALHGLYEAGGGDPSELIDGQDIQTDGSEADETEGQAFLDGSGERSAPLVDPGDQIRSSKKASALRLQLEARAPKRKRRIAA